jgi:large subunit ribosomal protein L4
VRKVAMTTPKTKAAMKADEAPAAPLTIPVRNLKNETVGEASLSAAIFGVSFRRHPVWETVRAIRAAEHRGTHKTKTRDEVSGSGKKPFKQKHTGRARQGGGRPPIHRHGGTVFGPQPHAYDLKVNVRTKKAALRCVLSEKLRENQLVVLENLDLPTHKTKDLAAVAALLGVTGKTLLVDRRGNENLRRAAANHPKLMAIDAKGINVYDALNAKTVVLTEDALKTVTEVLG